MIPPTKKFKLKDKYTDEDILEIFNRGLIEGKKHSNSSDETKILVAENKDSIVELSRKFSEYMQVNNLSWQKHEDTQSQILEQVKKTNGRVTKLEGEEIERRIYEAKREGVISVFKWVASLGGLGGLGGFLSLFS